MRRSNRVLVSLVAAVALVGCGDDDPPEPETPPVEETLPEDDADGGTVEPDGDDLGDAGGLDDAGLDDAGLDDADELEAEDPVAMPTAEPYTLVPIAEVEGEDTSAVAERFSAQGFEALAPEGAVVTQVDGTDASESVNFELDTADVAESIIAGYVAAIVDGGWHLQDEVRRSARGDQVSYDAALGAEPVHGSERVTVTATDVDGMTFVRLSIFFAS